MMRWWMALLLALNLLTLAWQWDAFARWGWGPNTEREPERVQNQIRPEALSVAPPAASQELRTEKAPADSTAASASAPALEGSAPAAPSKAP